MIRALLAAGVLAGGASAYPPPPREAPERLPPPTQADWQKSINNLKLIGVACHNFHDAYGFLPSDITDKAGKPLLSWRVRILPYLGRDDLVALYKSFKLDEAWNGPTNFPLLKKLPTAYTPVRVKAKVGMTYYQGFAGPGAVFDPKNRRLTLTKISSEDGTSQTALVVEGGLAVEWTKPADVPFAPKKELSRLGGQFDGAFAMLFCDGSVMRVKDDYDVRTMKAVITWNGGEEIDPDVLRKKK
ncbi:MAG TPA: DUF1559 domain-containing protein [Fimbriiglobus sp.]|jgi:hypothetical protein